MTECLSVGTDDRAPVINEPLSFFVEAAYVGDATPKRGTELVVASVASSRTAAISLHWT